MLTLSMKMPLGEALAVSLIGLTTVIIILAIIACLIILVSKAIRAMEAVIENKSSCSTQEPPPSADISAPSGINQGNVKLVGTDEKTAAVIMAIVSEKSGIPLSRLSFKSIRLREDESKGDKQL